MPVQLGHVQAHPVHLPVLRTVAAVSIVPFPPESGSIFGWDVGLQTKVK